MVHPVGPCELHGTSLDGAPGGLGAHPGCPLGAKWWYILDILKYIIVMCKVRVCSATRHSAAQGVDLDGLVATEDRQVVALKVLVAAV